MVDAQLWTARFDFGGCLPHGNLRSVRRAEGQNVDDALQSAGCAGLVACSVDGFLGGDVGNEGDVGRRVRGPAEVERDVGKGERRAWNAMRSGIIFRRKWWKDLVARARKARARAGGGAERVAEALQIVRNLPPAGLSTRNVDSSEGGSFTCLRV